jgi:uncharacterized RDD family membrane protein YckC
MAAFAYEGVLMFGIGMVVTLLYTGLFQMRNAMHGRIGLVTALLATIGLYFVWFWSHGGQTVATKAWHIRLVDASGQPVTAARAAVRYVASWIWFLPALVTIDRFGIKSSAMFGIVIAGVAAYAGLTRLNPQRQFWHDVVCGTRLVDARPARPPQAA